MGCSASKPDERVYAEPAAPTAPPAASPFHPDPALEGTTVDRTFETLAPAVVPPASPQPTLRAASLNQEARAALSTSNPLSAQLVAAIMDESTADVTSPGQMRSIVEGSPAWLLGFQSASGSDVRLRSFDAVADTALRQVPVTVVASGVTAQDTVDELHDELSDIAAWRGESPALSMDELPGDMHVRRIEGRGNMARMHGYTADIHQFPTPGALPRKMQSKVDRRVRAWMERNEMQAR